MHEVQKVVAHTLLEATFTCIECRAIEMAVQKMLTNEQKKQIIQ
jgi:hypothetical protein